MLLTQLKTLKKSIYCQIQLENTMAINQFRQSRQKCRKKKQQATDKKQRQKHHRRQNSNGSRCRRHARRMSVIDSTRTAMDRVAMRDEPTR
jgi:hypothetical protein